MLAISGCLQEGAPDEDGDNGGSVQGVPADASKQEYVDAFEDLDSESITIQSTSPAGEGLSVRIEGYARELEEWSGGKLTVNIAYSNSISSPDEVPQAMAEGRVDMDYVYPLLSPSRFPKSAAFANVAVIGNNSPEAGLYSTWAGLMQAGLGADSLAQEFEQKGLKLLMPFTPRPSYGLVCASPKSTLKDLEGAQVRVSGGAQDEQIKAIGADPTSMSYADVYPALERGVLDCTALAAADVLTVGLVPVAPNFTIGAEASIAPTVAPYAFGLKKWESMALPYRQLIFDRLKTLSQGFLEYFYARGKNAIDKMQSEGGEVQSMGSGTESALKQENESLLSQLSESEELEEGDVVTDAKENLAKWQNIATEEGYSNVPFSEWAESGDSETDASPFIDRFWSEVMSEYRPE